MGRAGSAQGSHVWEGDRGTAAAAWASDAGQGCRLGDIMPGKA